jgi:sugar phosphate isomerase/epimerase
MTFSTPEMELADVLATASRLGYDGIEVRLTSGHKHGIEPDIGDSERSAARQKIADSGVALCCIATSCRYADPETVRDQVAETRRSIDLAGDLGAPCIRVFGGQIPDGISRQQAVAGLVEALGGLADHAAERGVTICVETHDDWCNPDHVAEVVRRVDHPAVAVNWDIMHPVRRGGATMEQAFETLKPWIRHVHFHDGTLADPACLKPIGEGDIDHKSAVRLLMGAGYDGYLSGEWINYGPHENYLGTELATMKGYEQES